MTEFSFNPSAVGLSVQNAIALAQASSLVYTDFKSPQFTQQLTTWGFSADKIHSFDKDGTQAFLVFDDAKMILAFRGTEPDELGDWATDAKIRMTSGPGGNIHRGFKAGLFAVWPAVEEAIEDLRTQQQTLWITGHSLGAALATLAVAFLGFRDDPIPVNGLYNFGSPRVGGEKFAASFNAKFKAKTFRFVNNDDVVTRVPPQSLGYSHVGMLKYFDRAGKLHDDDDLSWWGKFWDRMDSRLDNFLRTKKLQDGVFDGVYDHDMGGYLKLLRQASSDA